ncbi:MAG TPA: EAL domain-containing protein, partial [Acidimicrobiales bacterium]|nr:EAL domain-containing protein [Acidimicrobiales bacterium]
GALAEAVIQLGRTLHLQTIAEGIEEARQVDGLRALGCHFGQGFYFAKALPAKEIDELLSRLSADEPTPGTAMLDEEVLG